MRDAGSDGHLRWMETGRRKLAELSVFDIWAARRVSPAGQEGEFCLIQTPDWVNVVPVLRGTRGERAVPHGAPVPPGRGDRDDRVPAGLAEPGEDPRETALRELREETGQAAGRLTLIGKVAPNPAFMTNWCYTYLAEDLSPSEGAHADELELLETREVGARELAECIGTGEFVNSLVLVAWMLYRDYVGRERGADRN